MRDMSEVFFYYGSGRMTKESKNFQASKGHRGIFMSCSSQTPEVYLSYMYFLHNESSASLIYGTYRIYLVG